MSDVFLWLERTDEFAQKYQPGFEETPELTERWREQREWKNGTVNVCELSTIKRELRVDYKCRKYGTIN
jgi:hypothetical protein